MMLLLKLARAAIAPPMEPDTLEKLKVRANKRDREFDMWQTWKSTKDPVVLGSLFQSLTPLVRKLSLAYQGNLPPAFIEGEVKKNTLKALETWNPDKSQMNTHITNTSQKVLREIYRYQNPTRLAEESHLKVPMYMNVKANLEERLGRPPTHVDIAREMGIGVTEARRLETGARRDLGSIEGGLLWKPSEQEKTQEILDHVMYELTTQEQQALEYTFSRGIHLGKPPLSATQLADKLGVSAPRVSQIKHRIAEVIQRHYGAHKLPQLGS